MSSAQASTPARPRRRLRPPVVRRFPVKQVFSWLGAGWRLFASQPAEWILIALMAFVLLAISTLLVPIPIVGPILPTLMLTLLVGVMLYLAQMQEQGRMLSMRALLKSAQGHPHLTSKAIRCWLQYLLEGLRRHPGNLALIGLLYSLPLVVMYLLSLLAISGALIVSLLGWSLGSTVAQLMQGLSSFSEGLGIAAILFLLMWGLLILSMLFAPALVVLDDYPPLDAMRYSLRASLQNLRVIVVLAVVLYVLFAISTVALLGLGTPIFIPVVVGTVYAAYKDLFISPTPDVTPEPARQD